MSSSFQIKNYPTISTAIAITATATAYLAYKYPDCAVLDNPKEKAIPYIKGVPLLGNLPDIIANINRYYEHILESYEKLDTLTL
jgi:hypothetical protein